MLNAMMSALMAVAPLPEVRVRSASISTSKNYGKRGGKYMPHQGERECARRRRQMAKAAAKVAA